MGRKKQKPSDHVRVVARFRPHNEREKKEERRQKLPDAPLEIFPDDGRVVTASCQKITATKQFAFDGVLDSDINQEGAFTKIALDPCQMLLEGYNSTIFVYGQTGSGKTYTMLGPEGGINSNPQHIGLIPRAIMMVYSGLNKKKTEGAILDYIVEVSFLEIYLERFRDLQDPFSDKKLKVRLGPNGDHHIPELSKRECENAPEVFRIMDSALSNRVMSATKMNASSSRSHMVMMIKVRQDVSDSEKKISTMNFADLAGSEKMKKTEAKGKRAEEAKKINLSLTQLGLVISELASGKKHVSYRDSALTQVLQDSLSGNCKTTLVINLSKSLFNRDETIGTLEFGKRCKTLKTQAKVNQQYSRKQLMKMLDDLRADNAALIRKIENEEYELAKNSVDENALAEKMEVIAQLREEQDECQAEIEALQETNEEINAKLTAARFQTMASRKISETLRVQIDETKQAINTLEKELAKAHEAMEARQSTTEELKINKAEITAELTSARNELDTLADRLKTKEETEKAHDQKIAALEAQVAMAKDSSSKEANDAIAKIRELNETLETQLHDNRLKSDSQQETIHALQEQISQLDEEKMRLQKSLDEFIETLNREQAAHRENQSNWDMQESELKERIIELENLVENLELVNEKKAQEFHMQMRQKDMQIQNLQRHLEVMKSEILKADATKDKIIKTREHELTFKMTQRERELLQMKEEEVQAATSVGKKKILDLAAANEYLEKFNKQQVGMLEEADHAFAESLYEKEKHQHEQEMKKMQEMMKQDEQIARELAEELEKAERDRNKKNEQLNISLDRGATMRSASAERPTNTKKKPKKKVASHVDLGEQVKLHNNLKGIARFVGIVHWTKEKMIGIEILGDGKGNTNGSRDGKSYFGCKQNRGRFVSYSQISHVYRRRKKDGKEEKLRFSRHKEVSATLSMEDTTPTQVRPSYTKRELSKMTTEHQIDLAMKMSVGNSPIANQFADPDDWNPITVDIKPTFVPDLKAAQAEKKSKYKSKEKQRLMRHASVQILNQVLDSIDDADAKQMVLDDFVQNRKSSPSFVLYE